MSSTAEIIWKSVGLALVALLLIAAAVWGVLNRPTEKPCLELSYIIEDRAERLYLTEDELSDLLRAENLYPVGQALNLISLHRIEQTVQHHPMVRTAECYITPRNTMKIRITQRVPILRVQTPVDVYFIDSDRRVMQARMAVKDSVLLATGAVSVQTASSQLADFAIWVARNNYWRERVDYIRLQSPQEVYLYLRGDKMPRILLGSMRNYPRKLAKLRTFFEQGAEAIQDKTYKEIDVRFRGQVIGRK